ncbi:MAG: hypothetical protein ABL881_02335 [Novosphingobium sp.]
MTTTAGAQVGVTLYSFTNPWLTRQFDLEGLLREVSRRGMGPNIEIIGFQSFKEFPDISDAFAEKFKELMTEIGLNPVSCAINSDRFLRPGQQPIDDASLIEYHKRQLRSAKKMGFSLVRYQFALPVELLPQIAPYAEALDIRMGVEVHAPMWAGHPAVQAYGEMYDKLDTPYLGWIPDFGGTASRIPESMLDAARAAGAREGLLDRLKEVWLEPGMSHEKAGRLREWALAGATLRPIFRLPVWRFSSLPTTIPNHGPRWLTGRSTSMASSMAWVRTGKRKRSITARSSRCSATAGLRAPWSANGKATPIRPTTGSSRLKPIKRCADRYSQANALLTLH